MTDGRRLTIELLSSLRPFGRGDHDRLLAVGTRRPLVPPRPRKRLAQPSVTSPRDFRHLPLDRFEGRVEDEVSTPPRPSSTLRAGSARPRMGAHSHRGWHQSIPVGTASTIDTRDAVGTTRLIRKPASSSRALYWDAVRSSPPVTVSMTMSSNLPGCGASPSGSTISASSKRPHGIHRAPAVAQDD